MIEIEKKYRLTKEQFERVKADLDEFDAEYIGEDFEENILYGNKEFEMRKAVLRIRKIVGKTILTYKQFIPNPTGAKKHIEHETAVEDAEQTEKIIQYLGLEKKIIYEKRRMSWKFRDVEVVLDKLPFGLFMEIEGSITAIREAKMFLEAEDFEIENKTYPFLTFESGRKIDGIIEARFLIK